MDETLSGKVAAITGAASGIGLACARRCSPPGRGWCWSTGPRKLAELGAELGAGAVPRGVDLTDPAAVARMLPQILERPASSTSFTPTPAPTSAASRRWGSRRLGPDAEPERQRGLPLRPRRAAAHGRAQDRRHHRHQLGRRARAGGLGADLHRLQTRGAGLRPHRPPPGRQARRAGRRDRARTGGDGAPQGLAKEKLDEALAAGSLIEPEEVAEAVHFMLTRPRNVTIRDLVILPQSQDI